VRVLIETERLLLRPISLGGLDESAALHAGPEEFTVWGSLCG
jgi:hypothetical protein